MLMTLDLQTILHCRLEAIAQILITGNLGDGIPEQDELVISLAGTILCVSHCE